MSLVMSLLVVVGKDTLPVRYILSAESSFLCQLYLMEDMRHKVQVKLATIINVLGCYRIQNSVGFYPKAHIYRRKVTFQWLYKSSFAHRFHFLVVMLCNVSQNFIVKYSIMNHSLSFTRLAIVYIWFMTAIVIW